MMHSTLITDPCPSRRDTLTSLNDIEKLLSSLEHPSVSTLTYAVHVNALKLADTCRLYKMMMSLRALNIEISELSLRHCALPESFFTDLSAIYSTSKFPLDLSLDSCKFNKPADIAFAPLPLQSITISNERPLAHILPTLLRLSSLTSITIVSTWHSVPLHVFQSILESPQCRVKHLRLSNFINRRNAPMLGRFFHSLPTFSSLISLQLAYSNPFELDIEEALGLCGLSSLRCLDVEGSSMTRQTAYLLGIIVSLSSISYLNISRCQLDNLTTSMFMYGLTIRDVQREVYAYASELHSFFLRDTTLATWMTSHAAVFQMWQEKSLADAPILIDLNISENRISDFNIMCPLFTDHMGIFALRIVSYYRRPTPESFAMFCQHMRHAPYLRHLDISNCYLLEGFGSFLLAAEQVFWTDSTHRTVDTKTHQWKPLPQPILIPPLQSVSCQSNAIGITALAALARLLLSRGELLSIMRFDFRGNHFTFRGMELFGTILVQQFAPIEVVCSYKDIVDEITGDAVTPCIIRFLPLSMDVKLTYLLCVRKSSRISLPPEIHRQVFSFLETPLWRRIHFE